MQQDTYTVSNFTKDELAEVLQAAIDEHGFMSYTSVRAALMFLNYI